MTTLTLPGELARKLASYAAHESADGFIVVSNEYVESDRWHSHHLLVISTSDGYLFGAVYERGLTEMQDTQPWEYEESVRFTAYEARMRMVTDYVPTDRHRGTVEGTTTRRFRKRAIEVEALKWTGDNLDEMTKFAGDDFSYALDPKLGDDCAQVFDKLHSSWITVYPGQWVVKGIKGEFYPIADDVLAETYEPVEVGV